MADSAESRAMVLTLVALFLVIMLEGEIMKDCGDGG